MDDWLLAIPEKSIKYSRLLGDSQIVIDGTPLDMESWFLANFHTKFHTWDDSCDLGDEKWARKC